MIADQRPKKKKKKILHAAVNSTPCKVTQMSHTAELSGIEAPLHWVSGYAVCINSSSSISCINGPCKPKNLGAYKNSKHVVTAYKPYVIQYYTDKRIKHSLWVGFL